MATGNGAAVAEIERLRNVAWTAIGSATVDGAVRDRYWIAWQQHCKLFSGSSQTPAEPPDNVEDMLLTFAVAVREGQYGLGRKVQVQSVAVALRAVAQKYVLDGHADPRRASPAQHSLNLPIARLIKKFGDDDPPPQPKLAIPVSTIKAIGTQYSFGPHYKAVADMVVVAFFYLLRVGEYTRQSRVRGTKRTVPLRKCDVRLWRDGVLLDHESGIEALRLADSATISIAHTKNGTKGAVIHHDAIGGDICPVAALVRRVANLHGMPTSTPLSTVCRSGAKSSSISDRDVTLAVRWGATCDCLLAKGYTLDRVSSHSLRAGGAMAMKLSGATDSTIMRIGRWTSLTYLTYIHTQIGALSAGVAWKMSRCFTFQNVG